MTPAEILALASASINVFDKAMSALEAAKQNKEMTPEQESEYDSLVEKRMAQAHWKKSTDA